MQHDQAKFDYVGTSGRFIRVKAVGSDVEAATLARSNKVTYITNKTVATYFIPKPQTRRIDKMQILLPFIHMTYAFAKQKGDLTAGVRACLSFSHHVTHSKSSVYRLS